MSLGAGIFLASIVLGTVALFIAKDRWPWVRLALGSLGAIVVIVSAAYFWGWPSTRARVQQELLGIRIGEAQADLKFRKGRATPISGSLWRYEKNEGAAAPVMVTFTNEIVSSVYYDPPSGFSDSVGIDGIRSESAFEDVVARFGEPTEMRPADPEGYVRHYYFDAYHVFFVLSENTVRSYGIFDPTAPRPAIAIEYVESLDGKRYEVVSPIGATTQAMQEAVAEAKRQIGLTDGRTPMADAARHRPDEEE